MLLATVLPGLAATTYPAATNAPNIFFQTNTFLTNTYFGLDRTNLIGTTGSAINGVGLTNGNVTARNLNSVTNFDTRAWTNSSGDLYIGASPNSANMYFWNDGDSAYRHVYTAAGQIISFDANLSVTGQVNFNGGTVSAPLLTSSSTSNGPSTLELASAGWVRSLFNNGVLAYTTTNIDATATNIGSGQPMYTFASAIPASGSRTYTAPTSGSYIGSVMTTNTFSFIQGPIDVSAYMAAAGGSGGPSVSVHPEIYYSYDKTNWYGDWDSQNQTVTIGATNLYQFVVSFPAVTATNSSGFYLQRRFKIGTATGATKPNVIFLIGTNTASGTANASHISFSGPNSGYGNAYLAANQTWTGTNTFTGDTIFTAPVSFSQLNVGTMVVTNDFLTNSIGITVDGAGTAIASGIKGYVAVPYACTIQSCTMMANAAGTVSFEIWRTNSADASFPPTVAGAIGTNTLTADNYAVDSTLTGWTKTLAANDVLGFNVPAAATTITRCTLQLKVTHK